MLHKLDNFTYIIDIVFRGSQSLMKTDNLRFFTKVNEKEGMDCWIGLSESSYWLTGNSEYDCLLES